MRKVMLVLAVAAMAVLGTSCNKLKARDQLNKGVQAFTAAQYPEAVERFKTAVELDPGFSAARLYLATAYMQQYIPGADSPEVRVCHLRPPAHGSSPLPSQGPCLCLGARRRHQLAAPRSIGKRSSQRRSAPTRPHPRL